MILVRLVRLENCPTEILTKVKLDFAVADLNAIRTNILHILESLVNTYIYFVKMC